MSHLPEDAATLEQLGRLGTTAFLRAMKVGETRVIPDCNWWHVSGPVKRLALNEALYFELRIERHRGIRVTRIANPNSAAAGLV